MTRRETRNTTLSDYCGPNPWRPVARTELTLTSKEVILENLQKGQFRDRAKKLMMREFSSEVIYFLLFDTNLKNKCFIVALMGVNNHVTHDQT